MPRPERALDPQAGPVQGFAAELRAAREKAGSPTYLKMARATGRSRTALAEAAGGDHLATWETVEAYLTACGQHSADWLKRWEQVRAQVESERAPKAGVAAVLVDPGGTGSPAPARSARMLRVMLVSALLVLMAGATLGGMALASGGSAAVNPAAGTVTVVVQNKVASGATGFYEDSTPVYLSTKTEPMCSRNGCEVPGTKMWSGAVLRALCQTQGYDLTNANTHSAGIEHNPNAITSSRWYRVEMPTGETGYIAEAYLTPASRGGLGLPTCAM